MSAFPQGCTEEEEYLLERYRILRDKKKALQKLKEKAEIKVKPTIKREVQEISQTPEDAKRKAEMLVASGHVKISKTAVDREFKRARITEKKSAKESLSDHESAAVPEKQHPSKLAMREMFSSSFVKAGRNENDSSDFYRGYRGYREPRRGNTIFIKGYGLKEEIVKTSFNRFGTVIDARFEKERSHGFVTFKTCEEAGKAIEEMNGTMESGIHIEVSLARKQLHMDSTRGNQPLWASHDRQSRDRQGRSMENRELPTYDEDEFF